MTPPRGQHSHEEIQAAIDALGARVAALESSRVTVAGMEAAIDTALQVHRTELHGDPPPPDITPAPTPTPTPTPEPTPTPTPSDPGPIPPTPWGLLRVLPLGSLDGITDGFLDWMARGAPETTPLGFDKTPGFVIRRTPVTPGIPDSEIALIMAELDRCLAAGVRVDWQYHYWSFASLAGRTWDQIQQYYDANHPGWHRVLSDADRLGRAGVLSHPAIFQLHRGGIGADGEGGERSERIMDYPERVALLMTVQEWSRVPVLERLPRVVAFGRHTGLIPARGQRIGFAHHALGWAGEAGTWSWFPEAGQWGGVDEERRWVREESVGAFAEIDSYSASTPDQQWIDWCREYRVANMQCRNPVAWHEAAQRSGLRATLTAENHARLVQMMQTGRA